MRIAAIIIFIASSIAIIVNGIYYPLQIALFTIVLLAVFVFVFGVVLVVMAGVVNRIRLRRCDGFGVGVGGFCICLAHHGTDFA